PYHTTGRRMVTMLIRPDVADFLDEVSHTGGIELLLEQVQVAASSVLAGQTLARARAVHQLDVTVLACKNAEGQWNMQPGDTTEIRPDMRLIALGTLEKLRALISLAAGKE
ncbi:MAG TPA: TrkA C-terminal domain-containing protein, partial [Verrucomicrobiae bacterium]|nr:TrkA C-terminal domain-containing protein [Verrucomicrobiae bacterium]